jgi:DNA transformation protein
MNADDIVELFAAFGRVSVRRMFGGFGIYADGMMFALASHGVVYLKADAQTSPAFEREAMGPFTYTAKGRGRTSLSYWRIPDRLYDDAEELAGWARTALMVARRAKAPKIKARKNTSPKVRAQKKAPKPKGRRSR